MVIMEYKEWESLAYQRIKMEGYASDKDMNEVDARLKADPNYGKHLLEFSKRAIASLRN